MQQEDNLSRWAECWKATTSAVHIDTDENKTAETWNKRWSDRPGRPGRDPPDNEMMRKSAKETIDFLEEAGFSAGGAKVLDIGCGPGTLSLPLARLGAEVTALDISSKVLERVKQISEKEGLPVDTIECSWWSADVDEIGICKNYDLVIASRTPSINDSVSLEKMMACSKGMCYYSGFFSVREDNLRKEVRSLINKENNDHSGMNVHNAFTMFFPFMYLYFKGYRPLVKINPAGERREEKWEDAAKRAIDFFSHDQDLDEEVKEKIRNCYKDASSNGMYSMHPAGCQGMMVWMVNDR